MCIAGKVTVMTFLYIHVFIYKGKILKGGCFFNSEVLGLLSVLAAMKHICKYDENHYTGEIENVSKYIIKSFTDDVWQFCPRQFRLLLVIINSLEASDIS